VSTALDRSRPRLASTVVSMPKMANAPWPSARMRSAPPARSAASAGKAKRSRCGASAAMHPTISPARTTPSRTPVRTYLGHRDAVAVRGGRGRAWERG